MRISQFAHANTAHNTLLRMRASLHAIVCGLLRVVYAVLCLCASRDQGQNTAGLLNSIPTCTADTTDTARQTMCAYRLRTVPESFCQLSVS